MWWAAGLLCLIAPHLVGAPPTAAPLTEALRVLSVRFAVVSIATQLTFWLLLGGIGGFVYARTMSASPSRRSAFAN
jgi:predicted cobalt transporter CbtA